MLTHSILNVLITSKVKYFKPLFLFILIMAYSSWKPKIQYFRKIGDQTDQKEKEISALWKDVLVYALSTWLWLLLHELLHQCRVAWSQSAFGLDEVLWKPRLLQSGLQSALLDLVSLILLTIPHTFSLGFRSGVFKPGNWYFRQGGQVPSLAVK